MSNPTINGAVIGYGGQFNMGGLHLKWMAAELVNIPPLPWPKPRVWVTD